MSICFPVFVSAGDAPRVYPGEVGQSDADLNMACLDQTLNVLRGSDSVRQHLALLFRPSQLSKSLAFLCRSRV